MSYPTQGNAQSTFVTVSLESHKLGEYLNDLTRKHKTNWDSVHISTTNDGYMTYLTYRIDLPKDNAPAKSEEFVLRPL